MVKRRSDGTLIFKDHPEFRPNLKPAQVLKAGAFGGTYFRPIYSKITKHKHKNAWKEFPKSWFKDVNIKTHISSSTCNKNINKYKAKSGTSLEYWESKKWIKKQDPYGWFQWYCRFYQGRRTVDDERQIKRWAGVASQNGRFRKRLVNLIGTKKKLKDHTISPVIRQLLLQWAYELKPQDL